MENTEQTRAQIMTAHIAACQASGMQVQAYCAAHNIIPSNYWLGKIQKPAPTGKFISLPVPLTDALIYIAFANGTRVCFENMPPAEYVKKLVSWYVAPKFS